MEADPGFSYLEALSQQYHIELPVDATGLDEQARRELRDALLTDLQRNNKLSNEQRLYIVDQVMSQIVGQAGMYLEGADGMLGEDGVEIPIIVAYKPPTGEEHDQA